MPTTGRPTLASAHTVCDSMSPAAPVTITGMSAKTLIEPWDQGSAGVI